MKDKQYSDSINAFLTEGSIFVVKQCIGLQKIILAIFREKQEAERYLDKRKGCLDYEIDTVIFVNDSGFEDDM